MAASLAEDFTREAAVQGYDVAVRGCPGFTAGARLPGSRISLAGEVYGSVRAGTTPIPRKRGRVAEATPLTATERAKLEQRRDRLMKLMKEGDGPGGQLDAEDRADLAEEWNKIDKLLQGSR